VTSCARCGVRSAQRHRGVRAGARRGDAGGSRRAARPPSGVCLRRRAGARLPGSLRVSVHCSSGSGVAARSTGTRQPTAAPDHAKTTPPPAIAKERADANRPRPPHRCRSMAPPSGCRARVRGRAAGVPRPRRPAGGTRRPADDERRVVRLSRSRGDVHAPAGRLVLRLAPPARNPRYLPVSHGCACAMRRADASCASNSSGRRQRRRDPGPHRWLEPGPIGRSGGGDDNRPSRWPASAWNVSRSRSAVAATHACAKDWQVSPDVQVPSQVGNPVPHRTGRGDRLRSWTRERSRKRNRSARSAPPQRIG